MESSGHYLVDLDGTLAHYVPGQYKAKGATYIGEPIMPMVRRVRQWILDGIEVKIFTARAHNPEPGVLQAISDWCLEHVGVRLEVTCIKSAHAVRLYDDRAVQVVANTGEIVE